MPNSPTIREIALRSGCSHTTVSKALRNSPDIPATTRDAIARLANEMGYRRNPFISAWMSQRRVCLPAKCSDTIAFLNLFPDRAVWNEFASFLRYVDGARERAQELGFQLEEFWLGEKGMTASRMTKILQTRGIHGVIIGSSPRAVAHLRMDWSEFAIAAQAYSVEEPKVSRTANNYSGSLSLALRKLRQLGYERIGLVLYADMEMRGRHLWSGAFAGYQHRIAASDRIPIFGLKTREESAFRRWFSQYRPEAILTQDPGVVAFLGRMGLTVPDDVGVAKMDLHPRHGHLHPEDEFLAGIDQQLERAGAAAVDLVATQLMINERGIPRNPRTVLTDGVWVKGKSVRRLGKIVSVDSSWKTFLGGKDTV